MREVVENVVIAPVVGSKAKEGTMEGFGNLDLDRVVNEIDHRLRLLVNQIESDVTFEGGPFSNFVIKRHPKWQSHGGDARDRKLIDEYRREVLEAAPALALENLNEMPTRLVSESMIAFVLRMVAKRVWIISKRGRRISGREMYGDYAAAIAKSKADEIRDRCTLAPVKRCNKAALLYEVYFKILKELRRVYFSSQSDKIRRSTPGLQSWKEKKAEVKAQFPELATVLDIVGEETSRPRDLALDVVAERLETTVSYAERLVSEGNRDLGSEKE